MRKTRFGDTSLIVTWLTVGHGRLKTVVKGALRPKSRFAGVLDLFYECEISYARSTKSELHTLREASLQNAREGMRVDYPRVALASYCVELMELATEPEHEAPELFDLLQRLLRHLDEKPATQRAMVHYETELARLLGITHPNLTPIVAIGRAYHHIPTARPSLLKMLP